MAATIKDIARATGLSVATVSKFLNGGNVLEKNRVLLEQAIREQDYHINEYARALKTNRSRTVGFIVPKFGDVFSSELASEAVTALRKHQYSLFVCESHNSMEGEREAIDFLASKQVDGIMATLIGNDGWYYKQLFGKYHIPLVLFDRKLDTDICDTVVIDNAGAAYQAVRQLIDAGHREIAIVRGPRGHYTADQRYEGYERAMQDAGLPIRDEFVRVVDYADTNMYDHVKQLFALDKRPTAVFSINYFTTMTTIMALNELDIDVPRDISVFGFDNYHLSQIVKPRLWLAEQPLARIAEEGTRLLLNRINAMESEDDGVYRTVVLRANILEGDSVRRI